MKLLPRHTTVALAVVCAIGSAACVKQEAPGVGLVKFDSSAVFGIAPKQDVPVPGFELPDEAFDLPDLTPSPVRVLPIPDEGPCPDAKLTAFPKKTASVGVDGMPAEGLYKWTRNTLTLKDVSKTPPIKDNPFVIQNRAVRRVVRENDHKFRFEMVAPDPFVDGRTVITSFTVNTNPQLFADQRVPSRTIGIVNIPGTDLRVANPADSPGIFITRIETQDDKGTRLSQFNPVQPMLVAPLEGGILRSGQEYRSVGIDALTGSVVANTGLVGRTSRVDACGEIVEGYTVTLHQVLTSDLLDNPQSLEGEAFELAISQQTREIGYTFATQYGALPIAEALTIGDLESSGVAAIGSWELGALTPAALPDSLK